jgi:NAD(P)-dependent dehydrogenase (short-subunit alcohol dehydrogenase family)
MRPRPSAPVKERARALVTGGAVRIGRAIALALADAGMDVAVAYHRSAPAARRTVRALRARGVRGVALAGDLADPEQARRLVTDAARALGGLDVLVNNAAIFGRTPFHRTAAADFDRFLAVNLRGSFLTCQAAAALMRRRGGHIVNLGDAGTGRAWPGYIPYALSKVGVTALTRYLAVTLRPYAIAVNCVAPGAVLRPRRFAPARWAALTRGLRARPEDVARAVLFFATCPPSITGQVLAVDDAQFA